MLWEVSIDFPVPDCVYLLWFLLRVTSTSSPLSLSHVSALQHNLVMLWTFISVSLTCFYVVVEEGRESTTNPNQNSFLIWREANMQDSAWSAAPGRRHRAIAQHFSPLCSDFLAWFGQQVGCPLSLSFALLPLQNSEAFAVFSLHGCWQFRKKSQECGLNLANLHWLEGPKARFEVLLPQNVNNT